MPLGRKLVVEFIGTFFLVFTVCTAINSKTGAGRCSRRSRSAPC